MSGKSLLIFEMIPDEINFYVLEGLSDVERSALTSVHGLVMNHSDFTQEQEVIFTQIEYALTSDENLRKNPDVNPEWFGKWVDKKVGAEKLLTEGPFQQVFFMGFAL